MWLLLHRKIQVGVCVVAVAFHWLFLKERGERDCQFSKNMSKEAVQGYSTNCNP